MNCSQCGTPLAPTSGFCGACGKPTGITAPAPHGYPPPGAPGFAPPGFAPPPHGPPPGNYAAPPQGYAPGYGPNGPNMAPPPGGAMPPYAQHGGPPPGQFAPPGPHGGPPPGPFAPPGPQHGGPPPGQFAGAPGAGYAGPLKPYQLVLQQRLTRLTGHIYLAPTRLYFLCSSTKGGLAMAIGQGIGGLVGGLVAGLAIPGHGAAQAVDENTLIQACSQTEGSLIMDPPKIKKIVETMWTRGLWFDGKTYALREGLSKELKPELGKWCIANNVQQKGLVKK